jgi:hypothetical protein
MTDTDLPPPLFIRQKAGPAFTLRAVAQAITGPKDDPVQMYNRVRGFAQRAFIHRATKGDDSGAARFHVEDIAAAAVLSALLDFGLEMSAEASLALYSWSPDNPVPAVGAVSNPIRSALAWTSRGGFWVLKTTMYRHTQTGDTRRVVQVYDAAQPEPTPDNLDPAMMPVGSAFIHLAPLLLPLLRLVEKPRADRH